MGRARRKGKVAKSEWPKILHRHSSGEALASIARDYGCTAPAIRYIVGRAAHQVDDTSSSLALRRNSSTRPGRGARAVGKQKIARLEKVLNNGVTTDVALFLVAVDSAAANPTTDKLMQLRSATDRVMRCAARILIELERADASETSA